MISFADKKTNICRCFRYACEPTLSLEQPLSPEEDRTSIRMSRSFDFNEDSPRFEELMQNNSALARLSIFALSCQTMIFRVAEIARRAGVNVNGQLDSLKEELNEKKLCIESRQSRSYFHVRQPTYF